MLTYTHSFNDYILEYDVIIVVKLMKSIVRFIVFIPYMQNITYANISTARKHK